MATYYVASSLDGFIATPEDTVEWLDALPQPDPSSYEAFIANIGAICMGRATYEFVLRHIEGGGSWPYEQPCWVFTNKEFPPQDNVHFVSGKIVDVYPAMKAAAGEKEVWVVGGGELAAQFADAGLLETMIVTIASVTLGSGAPLMPRRLEDFRLQSVKQMGEGFVELRYARTQASQQ